MRIGKRLFPYPTINNSKVASCFKNSNYSLEYDDENDNENLILKNAHIQIDNDELIKLIVDKKAEAVIIIECSSTIFITLNIDDNFLSSDSLYSIFVVNPSSIANISYFSIVNE